MPFLFSKGVYIMDIVTAETIGKKSKALKHCDKLLSKIDKNGSAKVVLNCTGVEFVVPQRRCDLLSHTIDQVSFA